MSLFEQPGLAGLRHVVQGKAHEDDVEIVPAAVAEIHKVAVVPGGLLLAPQSPASMSVLSVRTSILIAREDPTKGLPQSPVQDNSASMHLSTG